MMRRLIALLVRRGMRTDDLRVVLGYDEAVARANRAEMERDQLKAAVAKVRELHRPHKFLHCIGCGMASVYPCPTITALAQPASPT